MIKIKLFTDSDTYMNFTSRAKAFVYAEKNELKKYMVLTEYEKYDDINTKYTHSVFNPFLTENPVEYFMSEDTALKYIGSFL